MLSPRGARMADGGCAPRVTNDAHSLPSEKSDGRPGELQRRFRARFMARLAGVRDPPGVDRMARRFAVYALAPPSRRLRPLSQRRFGGGLRPRAAEDDLAFVGLADMERPGVERLEARPVPDGQDRRARQLLVEERKHVCLTVLVEGRGRLVHEHPCRPMQEHARERDALLLAERQRLVPAALPGRARRRNRRDRSARERRGPCRQQRSPALRDRKWRRAGCRAADRAAAAGTSSVRHGGS